MWYLIIGMIAVVTLLFVVSREDDEEREYYDSPRYRTRINRLYGRE